MSLTFCCEKQMNRFCAIRRIVMFIHTLVIQQEGSPIAAILRNLTHRHMVPVRVESNWRIL